MNHGGALFRFLLVGGGFAGAYAICVAALINLADAPPFWTSVILYAVCIPLAFQAQKRLTFRLKDTRAAGFLIYAATQVATLALVSGVTTRFVTDSFLFDTGLYLVTAGMAAVLSFLVCRAFAFKPLA